MEIVKERDVIAAIREHTSFVSPKAYLQVFFKEVTCLRTYRNSYPRCQPKDRICFFKGDKYRLFIGRFPKTGAEMTETSVYVFVPGKQEFYVTDDVFGDFENCPDVFSCTVGGEKYELIYAPSKDRLLVPSWFLSQTLVQDYVRQEYNNSHLCCFPAIGYSGKNHFIGWQVIDIAEGNPVQIAFFSLYNGQCLQKKFKLIFPISGVSITCEKCRVSRDGDYLRFYF